MVRAPHSLWLAILFLAASSPLHASEVVNVYAKENRVEISKDEKNVFSKDDHVCISRDGKKLGCGHIIEIKDDGTGVVEIDDPKVGISKKTVRDSPSFTYLELVFADAPIKKGDDVEVDSATASEPVQENNLAPIDVDADTKKTPDLLTDKEDLLMQSSSSSSSEDRAPTNETPASGTAENIINSSDTSAPLSDIIAGLNYIFPNVQYQQAVSRHFTTGLTAIYLNSPVGAGNLQAAGGLLTLNYYSEKAFSGSWVHLGAGWYQVTASSDGKSDTFGTPVAMAMIGWRFLWNSGFNFGFGVGGEYLFQTKSATVDLGFSGLLPAISLDLGFAF